MLGVARTPQAIPWSESLRHRDGPGMDAGRLAHAFDEQYEFSLLAANMGSPNRNELLATPVSAGVTQ